MVPGLYVDGFNLKHAWVLEVVIMMGSPALRANNRREGELLL
jgi:hypothetical protein